MLRWPFFNKQTNKQTPCLESTWTYNIRLLQIKDIGNILPQISNNTFITLVHTSLFLTVNVPVSTFVYIILKQPNCRDP